MILQRNGRKRRSASQLSQVQLGPERHKALATVAVRGGRVIARSEDRTDNIPLVPPTCT